MDDKEVFLITQRQYDIIMRQGLENLPQESGGFLGGKDNKILGIMPVFNQSLYDKTETFAITSEDYLRAHEFFESHGLTYLGLYHSHPKGLPEPSHQDLTHQHKYHFIVGLRNPKNPEFSAFQTYGYQVRRIPIQVLDNKGVAIIDLQKKGETHLKDGDLSTESQRLAQLIENIKQEQIEYPKLKNPNPFNAAGFSTIA